MNRHIFNSETVIDNVTLSPQQCQASKYSAAPALYFSNRDTPNDSYFNNGQGYNNLSFIHEDFCENVLANGRYVINCKVPKCDYQSDKKSNFKRHFETMHHVLNSPIVCCETTFLTKGEFRHHSKSVHTDGHRCLVCRKLFNRKALLERHMSIHTGSKPFRCSKCSYASANKANVIRHLLIHVTGASIEEEFGIHQSSKTNLSQSLLNSSKGSTDPSHLSQISPNFESASSQDEGAPSVLQDLANLKMTFHPKKTLISHSIDSILSQTCTKTDVKQAVAHHHTNVSNNPTLPTTVEIRKSMEINGIENGSRINEDWSSSHSTTNWSHTSPFSSMNVALCHQFNPSSVALFQQHSPASFVPWMSGINPFYGLPYSSCSPNNSNRHVLSDETWGVTAGSPFNIYNPANPNNLCDYNEPKQTKGIIVSDCSINQDLRLVPEILPVVSSNFTHSVAEEPFVIGKKELNNKKIHDNKVYSGVVGMINSGKDSKYIEINKGAQYSSENGAKKRAYEHFMNESPPVLPETSHQHSLNNKVMSSSTNTLGVNNDERSFKTETDNYIPKKLRLSKKFGK